MIRTSACLLAVGMAMSAAQAQSVAVDPSTSPWLGFMNVFELPVNGGGFVFGSGWGTPDLNSSFDDVANTLTLSPNTIGDPNEFWYQGGRPGEDPLDPNDNGGPGALGNKIMEANLYQEATDVYNGVNLNFSGTVLSNSFTGAHVAEIFIKDFVPDYSSFTETRIALTPGAFSINHVTDAGLGRHVQWGFTVTGENVWVTDVAPFGDAVIQTIPTPASAALLGLGGLFAVRRRR